MVVQKNIKCLLIFMSFAFVTHVAYNFYFQRRKEKQTEVNEVIMFSHGTTLPPKRAMSQKYILTPSMERLLYYLNTPHHSLDICMYVFTSQDIMNVIMKLRYRQVKIRLIIDADMAFASGSHARRMERQGIPVRWMKSTNLMHHKFCLLDASSHGDSGVLPLVMMGSLNWTTQALSGNWEDVIVTSQKELVSQYRAEFERLWELFKPIVAHTR